MGSAQFFKIFNGLGVTPYKFVKREPRQFQGEGGSPADGQKFGGEHLDLDNLQRGGAGGFP